MAENKTEQATPRRRQKAREKGQVVRSRDLIASLATMAATLILCAQLKSFPGAWRDLLRENLDVASAVDAGSIFSANRGLAVFRGIAITAGLTWLCASFAAVAQGGLIFAPSSLAPNLSRISPVSRFEQLFSLTSLSRLLKSLLPAAVVVYLAFSVLARDWQVLPTLLGRTVGGLSTFVIADVFEIAWKSALLLLAWSGIDYLIERQKLEGDLRMSRQDQRDEYQGDGRQSRHQGAHPPFAAASCAAAACWRTWKRAAVVITNPTEYAVALELRLRCMAGARSRGQRANLLSRQIKEVARWHGIPLVENPPLAHALYRAVEIGQSIPPKL